MEGNNIYPTLTFDYTFKVEVFEPDFEPLSVIKSLDVRELAANDQEIEIGYMKGVCSNQPVYAHIKKGMVVDVEVKPCEHEGEVLPMSESLETLVANVRKELESSSEDWQPMPVEEFVALSKKRPPIKAGHGTTCFWICVFNWGCLICCKDRGCYTTPRGGNLVSR